MDFPLLLVALVLGIIEGLTEFLPVSSTGHLIIFGDLLGYNDDTSKVFKIVIQLAAILAVCWDYRERLIKVASGLRTVLRQDPDIIMVGEIRDQETIEIEKHYFLLNSDLKAISYLDYFDFSDVVDLGFGYKIKLHADGKYFFMTYDLEALTNAEWDHFEKENGKLKAMIYTVYDKDYWGKIKIDSFGMPVEKVSSTTK